MASPHPDEREVYRFTATDTEGNRREGTVLATDPGDVAHQLPTGWTLRECRLLELAEQPLPAWAGGDAPPAATTPALTLTDFLTESDAGEMATHLAALAQSGIPLEGGLRALAEELPDGRVKRAVQRLAAELEAGTDLESALGSSGVPESLRVVVRAGLQRGDLGATLARHAAISQTLAQSRLLVWSALAGPLVASVLSVALLLFLLGWLVPRFAELYEGFGLQLSGLTRVVLALGRWLNRQAPWLLLVGLGGLVAVGLLGRLAGRRALLATCLGWVPLVGSLLRTLGLVRLCDMLSLLVESHVPLPEALRLAGQASGDQVLTQESERLAATLTAGGEVTEKPREWQKLPAGLVELIANAGSQETLVALLQAQACLQVQRARG
ncbi:MAG: type II secretion system F family protein, partial [Planctomycetaceae bacterium]